MGLFETVRVRLAAALSPNQMTQQYSKPKQNANSDTFNLAFKDDGLDYEDYDKMLRDPQIKSGFELLRMFLLSRKLIVIPASDDEQDATIAKELEDQLGSMKYPMRKVRNDMYSALLYGYSVSEVNWGMEDGDEFISVERIRPIPIDTIQNCFRYNDNGDVEFIIQTVNDEEIEIPAEKCLIYSYDEQFGDRTGKSILDAVYENWYHKQKLIQLWNVFLQKHEGPTLAGFVENPQFKDMMRDQLDDIREGRTNITAGVNDRIEILESSHRGEGFKEAINYHDVMIFRKMNIGTMILGQENGSGAYSQSQTQFDTLSIFLDGIHEDIAAELQSKINELIDMNWNVEDYPTISFETFEEKDLLGLIAALQPLIQNMAIDPDDSWFKHLISDLIGRYSDVDTRELLEQQEEETLAQNDERKPNGNQQVIPTAEEKQDVDTETNQNVLDALKLPNATLPGEE